MCGTSGIAEFKSPSGNKTIVRSVFGCGATTSDTTTLKLKGIRDEVIISVEGSHDILVQWIDEKSAIINYSGNPERIYNYLLHVKDVKFIYKNGTKDLEVTCLYNECQKIDREKALIQRKEWCDYSKENREYCNSPEKKGWETCEDGSWCHYSE